MSQSDRTVKLTVDIQTKISDLDSQVSKMQKTLEKLKLPTDLDTGTKKALDELQNRIKNIQQYTKNNKLKLVDEKKVQSEISGITKDFENLFKKIGNNSEKISLADKFKVAKKELSELTKALDNYNKKINESQEAKDLADVKRSRKNIANTLAKNEAKYTVDSEALENTRKQLDTLRNLEKAGQDVTEEIAQYRKQEEELGKSITKTSKAIEVGKQQIANYDKQIEKLEETLNNISSGELTKIKDTLTKLQDSGKIKLGFDPSTIESAQDLKDAIKNIDAKNLKEASKYIEDFKQAATQGESASRGLSTGIGDLTYRTKEFGDQIDSLKSKVTYFFGLQNAVNLFKRAVRAAYETVKDLDAVMTETAVVTDFSVGDMWDQLPEYTKRANELGVSIHDAYEAATLYYQQGLSTNEVMAVSNETLKMARIAGLEAADATDRMTNALRGFNMEITEANAQNINDVYSDLAAKTASNVDEISVAMTKVASLAHNANMSFENTAAFLSQIIETTRESAETAGTALKTVIARFSEVKELYSKGDLLGTDEEGEEIDVNKVSKALRSAGINLNEYLTGTKGLDDIFMELSAKWDSLDQVQQRYIATMAAGSRQQSRFIALMQDNARMTELVGEANNAAGASQRQFEKTLDSLETKLNQLKNAWDTFLMGLANNEVIKLIVDILTGLLNTINNITGKMPGLIKSFANLAIVFGGLKLGKLGFDKTFENIGKSLGTNKEIEEASKQAADSWTKKFSGGIKNFFTTEKIIPTESIKVTEEIGQDLADSFTRSFRNMKAYKGLNQEQRVTITTVYETQGWEAAQEEAQKYGATLRTTNEEIKSWSGQTERTIEQTTKKTTISYRAIGMVFSTISLAINKFAKDSESTFGKIGKTFGDTLTQAGTALMAFGPMIQSLPLPFKAAAGAGLLLINVFRNFKKETPEEQLKRAQKAAEDAEKAVETATESYNKLKDSLTELKEVNSSIDDLIVGTTEWKEAIQESNQQIIELISNYGQLAGYVKNENGRLVLDTESSQVQDILNEKNRAVNVAQIYQLSTKQDVLAKTNTKLAKDASVAGIGTEEMMDIAKAAAGDAESLEKFGVELEDALNFLSNEELQSLGQNILANEQKIEALNTAIASNITNLGDLDEEQSKYVSSLLNNGAFDRYKEAVSGSYKDWSSEDLQQELTEQKGYLTYDDLLKARGVESYSDEEIRSELENIKATDEATKSLKAFSIGVSKSTDLTKRVFSQENGLGLTKADVDALKNEVAEVVKSGGDFIDEKFKEIYGRTPTEEDRNSNEYKNIQYQYDAAITGADAVFSEIEEKLNILPDNLKNSIIGTEDKVAALSTLDAKSYQEITDNLLTVFSASGEAAAQKIVDDFNNITKQGVDANQLASALNMIDWKNLDNIEDLPDSLKNVGIEIPTPELEKFIKDLKDGAQAIRNINLETLIQNITDLGLISKNIREGKQDRTFSEEDYNKLISADSSLAGSFTKNLEGDFVFVGDKMEILTKAIDENTAALLGEAEKQLEAKIGVNDLLAASDIGSTKVSYKGGTPSDVFMKGDLSDRNDWGEEGRRKALESIIKQANIQGTDLSQLGIADLSNNTTMGSLSDERISQILDQLYTISQNQKDYETQLEGLREDTQVQEHLSKNTASENAQLGIEGDTAATSALKVQAAEAGVTEEVINELFAQIDEGSETAIYELGEVTSMFEQLGDLDIDVEEVQHLSDEIQKTNKALSKTAAAEVAIMNIKLNKGIQQIADSFDDWTKLIDKNTGAIKANVAEDSEVFNDLKESVNMMLNTAQPLSDAFWNDAQNITLLQEAARGSTEALEELRKAAAQDYILSLKLDDQPMHYQLNNALDSLNNTLANTDLPDLEPGITLDRFDAGVGELIAQCERMLQAGQMTVEEMQAYWQGLGYNATVKVTGYEHIKASAAYKNKEHLPASVADQLDMLVPNFSLEVTSAGGISSNFKAPSLGGSSGSPTSSKASDDNKKALWTNPYEKITNALNEVNGLMKERERLEREFQKTVEGTNKTNKDVTDSYKKQIENLKKQKELQEKITEQKEKDLNDANAGQGGSYVNSEGKRVQFSNIAKAEKGSELYKYREFLELISYDKDKHMMRIGNDYIGNQEQFLAWNKVNGVQNVEGADDLGQFIEEYYNYVQEQANYWEESIDATNEATDAIEDLNKELVKSYLSFEDRVLDAVITQREKEIEKLEQMSDAIKDASDKVISGIRDQVEKERQARQNEKTEEELAQKEARLEYLRRDTSGANQNEILQLEKEVEEARQSYEDTLVDQAIDKLQEDANLAAEQRAEQIKVMREQFEIEQENGQLWGQVYDLINEGVIKSDSKLVETLKETEAYKSMSILGKKDWEKEMETAFREAIAGLSASGSYDKSGNAKAGVKPTAYASGGLADFTGPAWLDGTKSKPELVLNAEDTRNFLALNDILGSLLSSNNTITNNNGGGDNYYTIEIDAVLGSDYDVDQLAARLKQKIVEDSSYRNVNSIGFIR